MKYFHRTHGAPEEVLARATAFFGARLTPVEELPRRRQDRVAAEEVELDLHRVAEPTDDVDVVPAFLVVAARRVVVDADDVADVPVEVGIQLRLRSEERRVGKECRL